MLEKRSTQEFDHSTSNGMVLPNKYWVNAKELSEMIGVSLSKSYKIINSMNKELEEHGFIIVPGKIPVVYVKKRMYIE